MEIKNIVLGIAIVILTLFVTINGISVFYPSVDYDNYCDEELSGKLITNEGECIDEGGRWNSYEVVDPERGVDGYCDKTYECRQDYDSAREDLWQRAMPRVCLTDSGFPSEPYLNGIFDFRLCRIGRCRRPGADKLLKAYTQYLSRDADEMDFARRGLR